MNIVHFTASALAGAPVRLCRILNEHTPHAVRLVDLERYDPKTRYGLFDYDVIFAEQPDLAMEMARTADVLHLHNEVHPDCADFTPIDFRALQRKGARIVRHFHSLPELVAKAQGCATADITAPDTPAVVIAQYPERFHPRARVVPNIIPIGGKPVDAPLHWDIFFSPTKFYSAWEQRWNTKGAPETVALMQELEREAGARIHWLTGSPLTEVLAAKQRSRIVLDDMVNGSYHLSGLEGLAMGKTVLCWLDARMEQLLRWVSGATDHPFVAARLEEAKPVLRVLLQDAALCEELGYASRRWMEEYWNESRLAQHYDALYADLAENPARVRRQPELALDAPAKRFFFVTKPELEWRERAARNVTP